jgi:two-component system response regulator YesN
MLKVMIVDDEIIVRIGLQSCISWEEYGYEVVGTAEDGIQALAMMEYHRPDVIFTDIRMPEMGGLELIRSIRNLYPQVKILVLSCLNDMEYVKEAIRLGAEDYILKLSLKPNLLVDILAKVKAKIEQERTTGQQEEIESAQQRYFSRKQIYQRILSKATFPTEQGILLNSLAIQQTPEEHFIICCCSIDDYDNARRQSSFNEHYLLKFAILNIINEFLSDFPFHESMEISDDEYLILVRVHTEDDGVSLLKGCHASFNDAVRTHLNITTSWGISDSFENLNLLSLKWQQAKAALTRRFFHGYSSFLLPEYIHDPQHIESISDVTFESSLLQAVTSHNRNDVTRIIDKWADLIRSYKGITPPIACTAAVEVWLSLSRLMARHGLDGCCVLPNQLSNPSLDFLQVETLDCLCDYLKNIVYSCIDVIEQNRNQRPEIIKLKQYIADNIHENITLSKAAKMCNLSRTYFSSVFKKETGENYLCYLNRSKMEWARDIIAIHNITISEAAYKVGIMSESHFCKLFRKYIGVNPSQIKHAHLQKLPKSDGSHTNT